MAVIRSNSVGGSDISSTARRTDSAKVSSSSFEMSIPLIFMRSLTCSR